jgi:adenylosuccinate synthase
MPVVAVVGGQWGDEGKGKVVDLLASEARVVIRAHGGDNAGHTVVNSQGEFALHLVPAGIFNPEATCLIGPGVAVNPAVLIKELDALESRRIAVGGLLISDRAHIVMPYHLLIDQVQERIRGSGAIGTTGRGIGPAYGDKVERIGLRMGDLLNAGVLTGRLSSVVEQKNALLRALGLNERIAADELIAACAAYTDRLRPFIADVSGIVAEALDRDAPILLEGAHGTLLDLDHGTYPYATSSSCTVAGLCQGAGVPPRALTHSIGVYKAYATRVGSGPMPTELDDDTGEYLRERAHEFGTTTGRARRCGWLDGPSARYSALVNGFDSIALTRLDVLDEMPSIRICVRYELDGKEIDRVPADPSVLDRCTPVLEELPGWETSLAAVSDFDELPDAAVRFVHRVEAVVGAPADMIGVGPSRHQTIRRSGPWGRGRR